MSANLNSNQDIYTGAPAYSVGALSIEPPAVGAIVPHYSTTLEVFDSLGAARTIGVGFLKTAPNTWRVEVYARPATDAPTNPGGRLAEGVITFNTSGGVDTVTGTIASPIVMAWNANTGADQTVPMVFDFTQGISQFSAAYGVNSVTADGVPSGDLLNLVLEDKGMLTAQFTNGRSRALYQVPIATFLNPNGLQAEQGGLYRTTLASGLYTINAAGSGRAGEIRSSVLEGSSVDLGTEFTQLITTQRAYSASSKIITTADEMLEELIRIKR
jgi:flagellar hook protein FlgE